MTKALTPMMRQYRRIKSELPAGVILFFRLGDFYEMFFDDAKEAAPILGIAFTQRNGMPMCGVPYHAVDNYLAKLLNAGRKVAICDQVEDPGASKGIVRREVTRVITPGTVIEDNILEASRHNFLAGLVREGELYGLAFLDLSTGLFQGEETADLDAVKESLRRCAPTECVLPASWSEADRQIPPVRALLDERQITYCDDWTFDAATAHEDLVRHFGVHSLEGFGCEGSDAIIRAAGAVLRYVRDDLRRHVGHVVSFHVRNREDFLILDETTCANLDLVPSRGQDAMVTLLGVLDATRTAMGSRALRSWVLQPLANAVEIGKRQDVIAALVEDRTLLRDVRAALTPIRDLERLITRISSGAANPREIVAVSQSLRELPSVRVLLQKRALSLLTELDSRIHELPQLVKLIGESIADEPPALLRDGGVIRDGYDTSLDELRDAASQGRQWLAEYQAGEQERTGIKTLKVRHNRVFGYYIEISRAQSDSVPEDYVRKQTLVNAERFITPELKEHETRVLGAQERAVALEQELFAGIRDAVVRETESIQETAASLATVDVLASLADRALALSYVRPQVTDKDTLHIRDGRHPVVEQMPDAERFVPNDTHLDCDEHQLIILTGPNMAGKSTYIRQVALIVVMAQMGSFIPASGAEIGVVDRVFTRVGASDDLARGRSTFMVEMQETANILHNASPRSLIVLDEIGRGTSTFDGISIAWAVAEHLHSEAAVKAKTLFATHYHELTDLALTMRGVQNYNVLVKEKGERVVFLRKIVPGGSDKSYGIQVARLAGLPEPVIGRAREILSNLEEGELGESGQPKIARRRRSADADSQMKFL
jgi:DNA mismatch repair protein MutS